MHRVCDSKIGVIGLGYVGLPLAVEFGKKFQTIGFDINKQRVEELNRGEDKSLEVTPEELRDTKDLSLHGQLSRSVRVQYVYRDGSDSDRCSTNDPDLSPLIGASQINR